MAFAIESHAVILQFQDDSFLKMKQRDCEAGVLVTELKKYSTNSDQTAQGIERFNLLHVMIWICACHVN